MNLRIAKKVARGYVVYGRLWRPQTLRRALALWYHRRFARRGQVSRLGPWAMD